jgi:hypothetical protein
MAIHRTAMGKTIDMSALQAKNERVRAVGNMSVNARGDTIDSHGKIIKPVTAKVNDAYSQTVGNRSSHVKRQPQQKIQPDKPKVKLEELTPDERMLEDSFDDDIEVEKIKAEEVKKGKK